MTASVIWGDDAVALSLDIGTFSAATLRSGGRRYVLSIGDEAVVLTLLRRGKVVNAWVSDPDPQAGAAEVLAALAEHRSAPLSILMDAFEQMFREEIVPRVGPLDQAKVVSRHLHMAFPGNNLQAALPHGQDPKGNRFYLFASVPPTDQVKGWLEVLDKAGRPPAGIHMLPLESLDMLAVLTPRQAGPGVRWRMLFSFNMTGGLRQIVAKQARIMLTRLTPPPPADSDITPADIVVRDYQQTLAYVKRMGYQRGDRLDLVILAGGPLAEALRERDWEAHSLTILSPSAAGEPLGLGRVGESESPYADVLHAAFLGAKAKPTLSLRWAQAPSIDLRRQVIRFAPAAAVAACLALGGAIGSNLLDQWDTGDLIARERIGLTQAQGALAAAQDDLTGLEASPEEVRAVLDTLKAVSLGDVPPLPLFVRLNAALAGHGMISSITMAPAKAEERPGSRRRQEDESAPPTRFELTVAVDLPKAVGSDGEAVRRAEAMLQSLAAVFGSAHVAIARAPVDIGADQVLRGGRGPSQSQRTAETWTGYSASFAIAVEGAA
jgi:hypothetical protein